MTTITDINQGLPPRRTDANSAITLARAPFALTVGQVIKATVVNMITQDEALLDIGGRQIQAKTPRTLQPNQVLSLKVGADSPDIILNVQDEAENNPSVSQLMMNYLPKQTSAQNLLALLSRAAANEAPLSALAQAINSLLNNITSLTSLTQTLHHAIQYSGYFFEALLMETEKNGKNSFLKKDFKSQLLSLLGLLEKTPASSLGDEFAEKSFQSPFDAKTPLPYAKSELPLNMLNSNDLKGLLKHEIEGVLARITASQLHQSEQSLHAPLMLALDIPVQYDNELYLIPLVIKEHPSHSGDSSQFSMEFALELERLGSVQAHVGLNGNSLNIQWYTDNPNTLNHLNQEKEIITGLMRHLGLNCEHWDCHLGLKKENDTPHSNHLLDINI